MLINTTMNELDTLKAELQAKLATCSSLDMLAKLCYTYWEKARELEMEINSNDVDIVGYLIQNNNK
jgi:hypothetical protein